MRRSSSSNLTNRCIKNSSSLLSISNKMVSTRQMSTAAAEDAGVSTSAMSFSDPLPTLIMQPPSLPHSQSYSSAITTRLAVARQSTATPSTSKSLQICLNVQQQIKQKDVEEEGKEKISVHLFDLPPEILLNIFGYLDFKEIGQIRLVSRRVNDICGGMLNSTFATLTNKMNNRFQRVKASMPRRESARRNHALACECDIVETCYMRLSLLQMTFAKHIERKHCCFFPGAILDEIYRILRYIKNNSPNLERPFQVTDELFDLSTMAMEYFKEKIEPILPEIVYFNKDEFFEIPSRTNTNKNKNYLSNVQLVDLSDDSSNSTPPQTNMVLRKGIRKIKQGMKMYNNQLSVLRNELRNCKRKSSEQSKQMTEQQKVLAEQQKQILEYANRLDENDKKNEEISRKFSTLLQELNKCKTELQYWRSKSPATKACTSCGHKLQMAPPEVYQALLNQGIKPEDIDPDPQDNELDGVELRNVDEDDSVEANISTNSYDSGICSTEFVSPDDSTTAKLLAINTATAKKRSYNQMQQYSSSNKNMEDGNDYDHHLFAAEHEKDSDLKNGGCPTAKFYSKQVASTIFASTSTAGGSSTQATDAPPDVNSQICIANSEPKKARRVQKNAGGASTGNGYGSGCSSSSGRYNKRK